jgi:hypothetical protein
MFRLVRITRLLEEDLKRAITLLTELRLIPPATSPKMHSG